MLKNNLVQLEVKTGNHGFLIGVEAEEGLLLDLISDRLACSLTFIEGVGKVEIEYLGLLDTYDEDETSTSISIDDEVDNSAYCNHPVAHVVCLLSPGHEGLHWNPVLDVSSHQVEQGDGFKEGI